MINPIIIKNTTNQSINITDLAYQYVAANGEMVLSDYYSMYEINKSQNLKDLINIGTIIVNDGNSDLSSMLGISHVSDITNYESKKTLLSLDDVPTPSNTETLKLLASTNDSIVWIDHDLTGSNSGINFTMSDHASHDYVGTKSTSWTNIRTFIYADTTLWTPSNFLIVSSLSKNKGTAYARLFDYTNNNVIALISWTNSNKEIKINNTLNNLPSSLSIIELQAMSSTSGTEARTHYMALY